MRHVSMCCCCFRLARGPVLQQIWYSIGLPGLRAALAQAASAVRGMADAEAQCRLLQLPFIVQVLFDSVVMRAIIGRHKQPR
jgi:hypothetical protein